MTIREITSAIEIQLQQLGDDSKIPFNVISFWVTTIINKYLQAKANINDSGSYLSIFPDVLVKTATASTTPNIVVGRKYIELPAQILDLDNDTGIDYITFHGTLDSQSPTFSSITFTRTTPRKARRLYMSTYENPSTTKNKAFYLVGDIVYLLGIENINIQYVEVGLKTIFSLTGLYDTATGKYINADSIDKDLPVNEFSDEIIKEVITLARFGLAIPEERDNDGSGENN